MAALRSHLLFLLLSLMVVPESAFSCSCISSTPREAFELADAVFSGEATDTLRVREDTGFSDGSGNPLYIYWRLAHFEVIDIWKGSIDSLVVVSTGTGGGDCGVALELGEQYLVYADSTAGSDTLTTSVCARTTALSTAELQNEFEAWSEQIAADADFDGSGKVDFADFLLFAAGYGSNQSQFDSNHDGIVNFADFLDFVQWFGDTVATKSA